MEEEEKEKAEEEEEERWRWRRLRLLTQSVSRACPLTCLHLSGSSSASACC